MSILTNLLWIGGAFVAFYAGSCIGKKQSKAEISDLRSQIKTLKDAKTVKPPVGHNGNDGKEQKGRPAKEVFLENIDMFVPRLNTLLNGNYNSSDWTDIVIGINNDELTDIWKKIRSKTDSVLRIFGMWGLKPEYCTSFTANKNDVEMYETVDGDNITEGHKYVVKSPCWILSDDIRSKKTVVLKGKVENESN